jgi:hypothetical protein
MSEPNVNINVRPDRGRARLTLTYTDGREVAELGVTLDRDNAVKVVKWLCEYAGLPEPWKKG